MEKELLEDFTKEKKITSVCVVFLLEPVMFEYISKSHFSISFHLLCTIHHSDLFKRYTYVTVRFLYTVRYHIQKLT